MNLSSNNSLLSIEFWFIPSDVLMLICNILSVVFSLFCLLIILMDKRCHTISMLLIGNTYLTGCSFGLSLLLKSIYTFRNDLNKIEFEDSFCIYRGCLIYITATSFDFSFLLQSFYRYVSGIHPNSLHRFKIRCQLVLISGTWLFSLLFPFGFWFEARLVYNVDNQICQLPLRMSFSIIYMPICVYIIPLSLTISIYVRLLIYVRSMNDRIIPLNNQIRAKRELRMMKHVVGIISILLTLGIPYIIFILMSFFTSPPKYHFRIAFLFVDLSLPCVLIILCRFTETLKISISTKLTFKQNRVLPFV